MKFYFDNQRTTFCRGVLIYTNCTKICTLKLDQREIGEREREREGGLGISCGDILINL